MEIFGYILVFLAAMLCWAVGIALTSFALSEMKTDKNLWDKMISACGILLGMILITFGLFLFTCMFYD